MLRFEFEVAHEIFDEMFECDLFGIELRLCFCCKYTKMGFQNPVGFATGLLIDSVRKMFLPMIPEASLNERREALVRASNYALSKGVTTVVDLGRYFPGASSRLSWDDLTDVYLWKDSSWNIKISFLWRHGHV